MIDQVPERYRKRIEVDPLTGCWLWTGAKTSRGRGCVRIGGRKGCTITVHRLFFELFIGPVPEGLELHHKCEVKHCCNPEHLVPKTYLDHKQCHPRPRRTHCPRGHSYTPDNIRKHSRGWYSCRICFNEAQLRRYHERKHG